MHLAACSMVGYGGSALFPEATWKFVWLLLLFSDAYFVFLNCDAHIKFDMLLPVVISPGVV